MPLFSDKQDHNIGILYTPEHIIKLVLSDNKPVMEHPQLQVSLISFTARQWWAASNPFAAVCNILCRVCQFGTRTTTTLISYYPPRVTGQTKTKKKKIAHAVKPRRFSFLFGSSAPLTPPSPPSKNSERIISNFYNLLPFWRGEKTSVQSKQTPVN